MEINLNNSNMFLVRDHIYDESKNDPLFCGIKH